MPSKNKELKVTLIRSTIETLPNHKQCIKGLGLRKIRQTVVLPDNACIRGMINQVQYLLSVEEV